MKPVYFTLLLALALSQACQDKDASTSDLSCLQGTWGLVSYFDSIEINRSITRHRVEEPVQKAILVEMTEDSISLWGSLGYGKYAISAEEDTLLALGEINGGWGLIASDSTPAYFSTREFLPRPYRRMADLGNKLQKRRAYLSREIGEPSDFSALPEILHDYWRSKLVAGKYYSPSTKDTVILRKDAGLLGIPPFTHYMLDTYLLTFHPFKNKDRITFLNKSSNPGAKTMELHWRFSDDTLFLQEFVPEMVQYQNNMVESGDFVLGEKSFYLIKL